MKATHQQLWRAKCSCQYFKDEYLKIRIKTKECHPCKIKRGYLKDKPISYNMQFTGWMPLIEDYESK